MENSIIVSLTALGVGLVCSLVGTPLARRLAVVRCLLDCPDGKRKRQRSPVPLLGGVAVLAAWMIAVVVASRCGYENIFTQRHLAVVAGASLLCAVGAWDDLWGVRVRWKLLAQFVATLPLLLAGFTIDRLELLGVSVATGVWALPISIVWYMAAMNAMNFIDGMDGLASLIGTCIALAVGVASIAAGGPSMVSGFALAGALLGFLKFNLPPAKIYLGDAGSMFVGLLLSWQVLMLAGQNHAGINPLVIVGLLAVPLADMFLAIFRRCLVGQPIWDADRQHVHHRLLNQRYSIGQSLVCLAAITLVYAGLALATLAGSQQIAWLAAGILVSAVLVRWRLLGHAEWELAWQVLGDWLSRESAPVNHESRDTQASRLAEWPRLAQATVQRGGASRRGDLALASVGSLDDDWISPSTADIDEPPYVVQFRIPAKPDQANEPLADAHAPIAPRRAA